MTLKIIKDDKLWLETEAIEQLKDISLWDDVQNIVGLPDLHSGNIPIGITVQTSKKIYPKLIGTDLGCGMTLYDTHTKLKKLDNEKSLKKLDGTKINGKYSIGGGNHFIELQKVSKIYDINYVNELNLDRNNAYLLVHSGSRKLGADIYNQYENQEYLSIHTPDFNDYINNHNKALKFATENRYNLAKIFLSMISNKNDISCVLECTHNYIEINNLGYFHHKGSISTLENKFAVIAGSRGSHSYIVKCINSENSLYSISHGAGRKWARNLCKGRLSSKYKKNELKTSHFGGITFCNNDSLLYEEATEAYKNIDHIIKILLENKCIELVAQLEPRLTYKC